MEELDKIKVTKSKSSSDIFYIWKDKGLVVRNKSKNLYKTRKSYKYLLATLNSENDKIVCYEGVHVFDTLEDLEQRANSGVEKYQNIVLYLFQVVGAWERTGEKCVYKLLETWKSGALEKSAKKKY